MLPRKENVDTTRKGGGQGGGGKREKKGKERAKRGPAGIEPTTSRTQSENHTTRPRSQFAKRKGHFPPQGAGSSTADIARGVRYRLTVSVRPTPTAVATGPARWDARARHSSLQQSWALAARGGETPLARGGRRRPRGVGAPRPPFPSAAAVKEGHHPRARLGGAGRLLVLGERVSLPPHTSSLRSQCSYKKIDL